MWDLLGSGIKSIVSCIGTRILYHWENFFKEPHSSLQLGEHWPSMPGAVQEATENQQSLLTLHIQELWVGQVLGQERMDCGGVEGGGGGGAGADPMKGNSWR